MISTSRRQAFSMATQGTSLFDVLAQFDRRPRSCRLGRGVNSAGGRGGGGGSRKPAISVFQARDFVLQARDLLLQRGAIFRHRLASPARGMRTAERDLPGLDCRGAGTHRRLG